MTIIRARFTLE